MTFFDHLEELRHRLLFCAGAVFLGTIVSYFSSDRLLEFLVRPLQERTSPLYFFAPQEAFLVKLKIAFFGGVVLAIPVVVAQAWLFLSPALYKHEKKIAIFVSAVGSFLFFLGVFFSFYLVVPLTLKFLVGMGSTVLNPVISASEYLGFLFGMLAAFGVSFLLPVFLWGLSWAGVDVAGFGRYRRQVIVLLLIAAAVLTPSPDAASQLFLTLPLWVLFELGILGARVVQRSRSS